MSNATLDSIGIHVEADSDWLSAPIFAVLDPLDSTVSTVHKLSVPSNRRAITAFLLGSVDDAKNDYASLVSSCNTATAVTFVDDQSRSTSVYILNINGDRIPDADRYSIRFTAELLKAT